MILQLKIYISNQKKNEKKYRYKSHFVFQTN